jgi:hypothetical protein
VALVKVVGNNLDQNLNGDAFTNTASQTIFQFGSFNITSNFEGRTFIDYSNELSTFVRPITLDTIGITDVESQNIFNTTENAVLNLDKSNLNTFAKFGSAYELLRVSVENIITKYPYSLYINSQFFGGTNTTFYDFEYNETTNLSSFKIPNGIIDNKYGFVFDQGNQSISGSTDELKNLNLSFEKYLVWNPNRPTDNSHVIVGFTGDSASRDYLRVICVGNPFPSIGNDNFGRFDIHLKPNTVQFEDFRIQLEGFEKNIVSQRNGIRGFEFNMREPTLEEDGTIKYNEKTILWNTSDGYNIDIDNSRYQTFLDVLLTIGKKYDRIKTDLIARFLTPASIKTYDLTQDGKVTKLLRIYGREFDQLKQFIDSLVHINKVTYDKKNNLPDQIVKNLARTFGWQHFQLVNEEQLVDRILSATEEERNLNTDLTPAEVDIELWRRILINTNYFWKSKGTREAIKSMFLLIGIPEPFINITEYVYTVNGRIDPREVEISVNELASTTLPYNNQGYPIAPQETPNFYFQISGDTDSGQAYMDVFRDVGFTLNQIIDNKKSWVYSSGATIRSHYSTRNYNSQGSDLVLNTKEVDIALDTARGIEYDVWRYISDIDFPANSTGFTVPYNFINLSVGIDTPTQYEFELPLAFGDPQGDVEIRYNGTLLVGPKYMTTGTSGGYIIESGTTAFDYVFSPSNPRKFSIPALSGPFDLVTDGPNRDVIEATYINKNPGASITGITVRYVVVRVNPDLTGTKIPLPEKPFGDVQLTINGIAAAKSVGNVQGDYKIDPNNEEQLIIQNPDLIAFFATNPYTQLAFITVTGSTSVEARNETTRVDSLCSGKVYFNNNANKFVYRLNYRIIDPKNVKILVDGIGLEPGTDYQVNPNNPYEVFLPAGINFGSVVTSYYIVGGDDIFDPIIGPLFGVGDITQMSFIEFIEVIQKKLINATNRKVITDFKGGWYPTLYKVYTTYLQRSTSDNPNFKTNGYTFQNLYPFLSKYNAFFRRFVDQLLSATIILRKGGLLIRNTVFTKQKFTYKRGVSFIPQLNYFGDDGSVFRKLPLQQTAEWEDENVPIGDLCEDFVVDNIELSYPGITTTTTAAPYTPVLYLDQNELEIIPITDGNVVNQEIGLRFSPGILPGYSVVVGFDFTIEIDTSVSGGSAVFALAEITIKVNGSTVYSTDEIEFADSGGVQTFTRTTSLTIQTGDNVEVILFNQATAAGSSSSRSYTRFLPTVTNITPEGSVILISPSSRENEATD